MKKFIKVIPIFLLFSLILSFTSLGYVRQGLMSVEDNPKRQVWAYFTGEYDENGCSIQLTNAWKEVNGYWLYFDENGKSKCNTWFQDTDGKWYYFDNRSAMLHDTTTPDGYTVGSDGAWIE